MAADVPTPDSGKASTDTLVTTEFDMYRQIYNIRCTKPQDLNVSHLVLQLPLYNPMKPGVKPRMKM